MGLGSSVPPKPRDPYTHCCVPPQPRDPHTHYRPPTGVRAVRGWTRHVQYAARDARRAVPPSDHTTTIINRTPHAAVVFVWVAGGLPRRLLGGRTGGDIWQGGVRIAGHCRDLPCEERPSPRGSGIGPCTRRRGPMGHSSAAARTSRPFAPTRVCVQLWWYVQPTPHPRLTETAPTPTHAHPRPPTPTHAHPRARRCPAIDQ